ncbi:MAG: response regulator [Sulfurimonas sp.]|nr:response regulator [Sulfurimonas sp.]MBU3938602.1 response regulator [bacterium]MBU4024669.1 response regulator [bacterium]MBU4059562.1 response regulator [bacterium]MBU4110958.1 response regulator [bacterium]
MNFFSFFSKPKVDVETKPDFTHYFTKELFAEVLDKSDSMILYFTKYHGFIGANQKFFQTFEYKNIEEFRAAHESIRELFLRESEEIFTQDDKSWLDYLKKYKKEGHLLSLANKNEEILNINAKCYTHGQSQDIYILELEDVTKLHKAELKTQEIERLKSKFLANIGHEFRTPMNGIIGFVELMSHTSLDTKQSEYVEMINRSSKNLMTNIETLLDLAQIQGGRLKLEKLMFNLLPQMEELAYNFCMSGREKGIKVLTFIDPKLPEELDGDVVKIKQIVTSLLQNAIKFTPRGGRVIFEVKLLKRQINGDCSIGFSVKDNGKGISSQSLGLITEPFNAGDHADERLGVGLSLAHGLVELMGSDLRIQSEEGHGSYFNFVLDFKASRGQSYKMMSKQKVKVLLLDQTKIDEANFLTTYLRSFAIDVMKSSVLDEDVYEGAEVLYLIANQSDSSWMLKLGTFSKKTPIVILLDEDQKLQTKLTHLVDKVIRKPLLPSTVAKHLESMQNLGSNQKAERKLSIGDNITALVVEDNLINQRLIQILLQEYRVIVSTASNGVEAVEKCKKNKYDIVFMDIDMPEKDGIAATKEIKEALSPNGETPFVALTAMAMQGDRERLLQEGLDDYLSKPLTRQKLENILNKYLKVSS